MATEPKTAGATSSRSDDGWGGAAMRALAMVVLSLTMFVVIPDRAVTYLSRHVVSTARDLIILAWMTFAFLLMCWAFVRLQGRRDAR